MKQVAILACALVALCDAAPTLLSTASFSLTPGPGLPSLSALGLTASDLLDADFFAKRNLTAPTPDAPSLPALGLLATAVHPSVAPAFDPVCSSSSRADNVAALACYNYLGSLGTTDCGVPRAGINMCAAAVAAGRDARVDGRAIDTDSSHSPCVEVAKGLWWVLDHCTTVKVSGGGLGGNGAAAGDQGSCTGGQNAAFGNGALVVTVSGHSTC